MKQDERQDREVDRKSNRKDKTVGKRESFSVIKEMAGMKG